MHASRKLFAAVLFLAAPVLFAQTAGWTENTTTGETTTPHEVGIGTTSPEYKLHVFTNSNTQIYGTVHNPYVGTDASANLRVNADAAVIDIKAHSTGRSLTRYGVNLAGWSEILAWPTGLAIGTNNASPLILGTNATNRLQITANGEVGIGGSSTVARLYVYETRDAGFGTYVMKEPTVEANTTQTDHGMGASVRQVVNTGVYNGGIAMGAYAGGIRAGAGSSWRTIGTQVISGVESTATGTVSQAIGLLSMVTSGGGAVTAGFGVYVTDVGASTGYGVYQEGTDDQNFFAGKVGIGTAAPLEPLHVVGNGRFTGNLVVDGNIGAKYQDVAEWVPATEDLEPGTVVVLDPEVINQVMPSTRAYDTTIAGVVSHQPGLILGEPGPSKEQVATTGRVKVRVDATAGPIRIGDLLVSGSKPGTAMKSQPVDVNGIAMHRPGTVIGKALEPLSGGVGQILVLLSLQ